MVLQPGTRSCSACKEGTLEPFPFTVAFQPIVNVTTGTVFAYEALVRGVQGQGAGEILRQVTDENLYAFDQRCRVKAITLATQLGLIETGAMLSVNFMPGAVYSPAACIQLTLETARANKFPLDRLMFEVTESERVPDREHLRAIFQEYRSHGFKMALDDFGAGYCGMNLVADLPVDIIKLDMELTRNLPNRPSAMVIVSMMVQLAQKLGCTLIAEGVETTEEYAALRECGIQIMQGYLFAMPGFESLPDLKIPGFTPSTESIADVTASPA